MWPVNDESDGRVRAELLELGLEDWIPIPEALANPEIRAAANGADVTAAVRRALVDLAESGEVVLYRGKWDADPDAVPREEGIALLADPVWFSFHTADPDEQRLYFVNAENIAE